MALKQNISAGCNHSAPLSDAELVHAARRGDKRAFVEIVARHQAMVCGIALGILGDFAASEDVGQEAFLTAWRKIQELRQPERLRAWLGQIARNAALGQLRQRRGDDALTDHPGLTDDAPCPDEATASQEELALVRDSLAKLPEIYRLPLVLFYRDGQSVRGAAEALGITEDALKQRLGRGREMLRERIALKIETTLKRTAPTAIFTMIIAAAIGALAAPAAVAGSVFAAASVSGASSAASSSTSVVTVMSTSKAFLVTTALVATICIPIGYQISSRTESRANKPAPAISPVVSATTNTVSGFEESALFAEWRALHDRYGTNAEAMPRLYEAIAAIKDRFRRQAFRAALISEWVQVDAAGGLPFFLAKGRDETQRREFFEEWLAKDPRAAINGLLAAGEGWETMARECLKQIARVAPERVPEIAARLPKSENYWDRDVQEAFGILAENDLASAKKAAEGMTGDNRVQALEGVAQVWGKSDFNSAMAWARSLPDGTDRDELIRAALVGKAAVDPAGALDSVRLVPPGGRYAHFGTTTGARVLAEAANADFDLTVGWIVAHPGLLSRDDLDGLAGAVTDRLNADAAGFLDARVADGSLLGILPALDSALLNNGAGQRAAVWDWLKNQPENEAMKGLKEDVLSSSAFEDPPLALRLVSDLPLTAEGDKQVKELARCLFNGGNALSRFDLLYQQAPDRLREPLVEAAFNQCLSGSSLDDPRKWIDRLALLPEAARPKATESLARAWGQQSPEEALAWTESLPSGDTQNQAMAAVTAAWAVKDAHGAGEWLAQLSSGPQRDQSAESFAAAVAQIFPREAWDWATSISDSTSRFRAATETIKLIAARDPASARQWIETGPFTPENKAQLVAVVEKASGGAR
jgi:RNA polymerase sigma factor (sigma-70 family)